MTHSRIHKFHNTSASSCSESEIKPRYQERPRRVHSESRPPLSQEKSMDSGDKRENPLLMIQQYEKRLQKSQHEVLSTRSRLYANEQKMESLH